MRTPATLLSLLTMLLLPACNTGGGGGSASVPREDAPSQFAATFCNLLDTCACVLDPLVADSCVDDSTLELETALMEAEAAGLIYDAACMGALLDAYQYDIGCKTVSELLEDGSFMSGASGCKIVYGTATAGQACTSMLSTAYGDSCAQGLFCIDDICEAEPSATIKQLGETCDPELELCETGSVCTTSPDAPNTFTCMDRPGLGESCMDLPLCEEGLGCDYTDFTCKGPVGAGEDCSALPCQDGYYCDSVCVATLAEGEPCSFGDQCGTGFECSPAADGTGDVCTAEQPLICP